MNKDIESIIASIREWSEEDGDNRTYLLIATSSGSYHFAADGTRHQLAEGLFNVMLSETSELQPIVEKALKLVNKYKAMRKEEAHMTVNDTKN